MFFFNSWKCLCYQWRHCSCPLGHWGLKKQPNEPTYLSEVLFLCFIVVVVCHEMKENVSFLPWRENIKALLVSLFRLGWNLRPTDSVFPESWSGGKEQSCMLAFHEVCIVMSVLEQNHLSQSIWKNVCGVFWCVWDCTSPRPSSAVGEDPHTVFLSFNFLPKMQLILWNAAKLHSEACFPQWALQNRFDFYMHTFTTSACVEVGAPQSFYV